jgi:hypothetical protein
VSAPAQRSVTVDASDFVPTPSQARFLSSRARHVMFSGGYGAGKALALDTVVPTADGIRTMGTMAVGDRVYDERGHLCSVVSVFDVRHGRPCYEVVFDDGSRVVADAEHLWGVTTGADRLLAMRERRATPVAVLPTSVLARHVWTRAGVANFAVPGRWPRYVVAVNPVPAVPVRCIAVDSPSRLFCVTERFIPTHNSRTGAETVLDLIAANPGVAGLVVSPTYQMMTRTTMLMLEHVIPSQIRQIRKADREWRIVNGARIYYGSADRPGSLEGSNVGWAWVDEARLISAEAWRTVVGRVRDKAARRSQILVTTTPAMGWLYDEFGRGRAGRDIVFGSTRENARNLGEGYVESLEATYSARVSKALIEGQFVVAEGAVYEDFNRARHLIDFAWTPAWRTVLSVDFGVRRPSVLLAQLSPDVPFALPNGPTLPPRSLVIVDELHPDQTPTVRLVEAIRARWTEVPLDAVYCDPAGAARDQASGMPSVHALEAGLGVRCRYSTDIEDRWIANGVALVQGALAPTQGAPTLYVARHLAEQRKEAGDRGVVSMLEGYRYPTSRDGRPVSDVPLKDGLLDHVADTLRYLVTGVVRDASAAQPVTRLLRAVRSPSRW